MINPLYAEQYVLVLFTVSRGSQAVLVRWFRRRREAQELVEADAAALLVEAGLHAYDIARLSAISARRGLVVDADRGPDHWDRVRANIGRRTRRLHVDTGTRYLMR